MDGWMVERVYGGCFPPEPRGFFAFGIYGTFFFLDFLWIFLGFLMGFGGDGDGGEGLGCLTPPEN